MGDYLTALEGLTPRIEAIGVTDYYVTDTYEEVIRQKQAGRLPDIKLIFPNIEVRSMWRQNQVLLTSTFL